MGNFLISSSSGSPDKPYNLVAEGGRFIAEFVASLEAPMMAMVFTTAKSAETALNASVGADCAGSPACFALPSRQPHDQTRKLLSELIALPSVNPAFSAPGDAHAGEQGVADFLAAFATRAKIDVEFKSFARAFNLIARLTPAGDSPCILLAPHLDTVNTVNEEQLVPQKGGRLMAGARATRKARWLRSFKRSANWLPQNSARAKRKSFLLA
jgi:hypothetical protein